MIMPKKRLKMISEGIFFSLLNNCIEMYGNIWGLLDTYDDQARKSTAFTKEDNMKLQIIVNKVLRSHWAGQGHTCHNSTRYQFSVHQRCTLYKITYVHKAIKQKQPAYSHTQFQSDPAPLNMRNVGASRVEYKLSISRGSYYYRGRRLYNQLPDSLTQSVKKSVFKKEAKKWVLKNIPVLPPKANKK